MCLRDPAYAIGSPDTLCKRQYLREVAGDARVDILGRVYDFPWFCTKQASGKYHLCLQPSQTFFLQISHWKIAQKGPEWHMLQMNVRKLESDLMLE